MQLLSVWSEDWGECFIPVDKIVLIYENQEGTASIKLVNGVDVDTGLELREVIKDVTRQGVFTCQATQ